MLPTTESADRIRERLERNLQEVFGEGDPARRRAAIEEMWTKDATLYVQPGAVIGHDAIADFAGTLRATHPDYVYRSIGSPQVVQNGGKLAWGSGPKGAQPSYTGWDVIIVRDDLIAALYVFLDESSDEFRRSSDQA